MEKRMLCVLLILLTLLTAAPARAETQSDVVYAVKRAYVYKNAREGDAVCTVYPGYPFTVLGTSGNYCHVRSVPEGFEGYIKKNALNTVKSSTFEVDGGDKVSYKRSTSSTHIPEALRSSRTVLSSNMGLTEYKEYLMYAAQSKVGCRYDRWPDNFTTFNNVSLVQTCLSVFGYDIASDVYTVGHHGSQPYLSREEFQKGDVVCFATDNDDSIVDHIGIYIGQGYFIHCSPVAGCVLVSFLDGGFYSKTLLWGRRYLDV